jgi:glycosyltransferase involved in cell wall biosynthesis
MQPWKGHSMLLRSLGSLRSIPTWRLWFLGGAQRPEECRYEAELRNEARQLGIEERVAFLGERANVFEFMSAADVLCQMNERPEPFGLVFVEALSQGLPVVAVASGGIPEIVTPDCGILASKGMLTAAVETLVRDSILRSRLAANGPARATELCDPERQTARIEAAILGDPGCA